MTIEPLKLGFDQAEFAAYCQKQKEFTWSPIGVTLHTTFLPSLAKVDDYLASKKWTQAQLVDNWWVTYKKNKWASGPHLFAFRDKVIVGTPLTMRGTHSPSFNRNRYGLELVGDYTKETLPPDIRANAVNAIASLYKFIIKTKPSAESFVYHGEDPRTTHKSCPGKMVGTKAEWLTEIIAQMAKL